MAEYVVNGAEPNETVLHGRTPNGYEEWNWLPVRECIVRCRDCKHGFDECSGYLYCGRRPGHCFETRADGFCAWGVMREDA